ncbi:hypothetical protein O59_003024 [Cellvibrio sp. BR]|jgi:hypothetical protein|uniref:hypothetical protein n=1 Tax=unclassified Cellvibrio TaxID=2624793 RepID=UPI000260122F|nr:MULTISPECIES: hypothetical protein [unclassified Cellvibrio]EIK43943.1 hypothetical protein O59_003024 [Cellvibrio sp. BR]QEY13734.1 type 1 pili tip component [Cellvibrio sp. KY-YJ-3]
MSLKGLVSEWEKQAQGILTKDTYNVHLTIEDAARIDALAEMYPKRTKEQLIRELLSAALNMVEESFPYVQGNRVIATDEMGDPLYEDIGPEPRFMQLLEKHLQKHQVSS